MQNCRASLKCFIYATTIVVTVRVPARNSSSSSSSSNSKRVRQQMHLRLSFLWHPSNGASIPCNAVPGGREGAMATYVGRAEHKGQEIPGKVVPGEGCYVSYSGGEHLYDKYDVLVNDGNRVMWTRCSGGSVPPKAIVGGRTTAGEKLYIGRTEHDGSLILGRVQPSEGCLYAPYAGSEHRYTDYEVLTTESVFPIG